jgi:hypothetical protein
MRTADGQQSEPPRAVVGFVAAAPPAAVDVDGDLRIVVWWPVDVQCQVRPVVRREYQVLSTCTSICPAPSLRRE